MLVPRMEGPYCRAAAGDCEAPFASGLRWREIAGRMKLSPKAAESLLTRARRAFHDGFLALAEGCQT